jgi:C-terminal processing protease CtpA/Prc
LDSLGKQQSTTISNFSPDTSKVKKTKVDSIKPKPTALPVAIKKKLTRKERKQQRLLTLRSLSIDTSENTAYMRIANFTEGHLRKFFRQSFKKLEEKQAKNLIIDLRENTGGYMSSSNLFTKYIINKPFKNVDTLAAITHSIKHSYYVRDAFKYWFLSHFISRKRADGRYHDGRAEKHYYQPKNNHHFNGKVYVLQGGYTYSAATLFTSAVKGQDNVMIIGEESGGGYYGNTATYLPTIILPNSKLRIMMPMYRMVMNANRKKDGKGVQPDVPVRVSAESIKKGIDVKLAKAKELIQWSK